MLLGFLRKHLREARKMRALPGVFSRKILINTHQFQEKHGGKMDEGNNKDKQRSEPLRLPSESELQRKLTRGEHMTPAEIQRASRSPRLVAFIVAIRRNR